MSTTRDGLRSTGSGGQVTANHGSLEAKVCEAANGGGVKSVLHEHLLNKVAVELVNDLRTRHISIFMSEASSLPFGVG